jgi:hypothetical protein
MCHPIYTVSVNRITIQAGAGIHTTSYLKNNESRKGWRYACLSSTRPSSNPSTTIKRKPRCSLKLWYMSVIPAFRRLRIWNLRAAWVVVVHVCNLCTWEAAG